MTWRGGGSFGDCLSWIRLHELYISANASSPVEFLDIFIPFLSLLLPLHFLFCNKQRQTLLIVFNMRISTPVLLCQFGWLVIGKWVHDNVTEIDLFAPIPNITYHVGYYHRFPIVWALQNASLWQTPPQINWRLDNLTSSTSPSGADARVGNFSFSSKIVNPDGVQFEAIGVLLADVGTYRLTWSVHSESSGCKEMPFERQVDFRTYYEGADPTLRSDATTGYKCDNASTIAYNITADECYRYEDDENNYSRLPSIEPCSAWLDETARTAIQSSLDAQYNKTCSDAGASFSSSLCPKKNAGVQFGVGAWLLGLPVLALFL